jgi:hypothetical protein
VPAMPDAASLLRLYPPAWRARYGEEFLATVGDEALGLRQAFDIVMVAIDAWLSSDVRNATRDYRVAPSGVPNRGGLPMLKTIVTCGKTTGVTPRDGFIGAGVMLGVSFLFSGLGIVLHRSGWGTTGEFLKGLAFPAAFTLSMPWWLMKGSPWKAQAVIVGGTLFILVVLTWVATKI